MMSEVDYPLTPLQKGMLFQYLAAPADGVYIMQAVCPLRESIDAEGMRAAWVSVLEHYPMLRTAFRTTGTAEQTQFVQDSVTLPFEVYDWRSKYDDQNSSDLEEYIEHDLRQGFDLTIAPLLRVTLLLTGEEECVLIFTNHHMILDGMSRRIILENVFRIYDAVGQNEPFPEADKHSFIDYVERSAESSPEASRMFWQKLMEGFVNPFGFTNVLSSPDCPASGYRYAYHSAVLSESITARLREVALQNDARLNTLVQLGWGILLARYTGESDIVFGATRTGRRFVNADDEDTVGLFINTLPVHIQFPKGALISEALSELRIQQLAIREYEDTPLISIQQWVQIPKGSVLFDSVINYNPTSSTDSLKEVGFDGNRRSLDIFGFTQFPVTLEVFSGQAMQLRVSGDRNLIDDAAIRRLVEHLENILKGIAGNPQQPIADIPVISNNERNLLLAEWNTVKAGYPREYCIHELFEAQVDSTPEAVAVVMNSQQLIYRQLNHQANQLAHSLISRGVGPGVLVGICLERSLEVVVCLLGILKAGGGYVPLDPEYPQERLSLMAKDAGIQLLLTSSDLLSLLGELDVPIVDMDSDEEILAGEPGTHPLPEVTPTHPAYVMYTSGSTGMPKGIEVTHRNVVRLVKNTNYVTLDNRTTLLQYAPISFDASTFEIWGALLNGGKLVVCPPERLGLHELGRIIEVNQVNTLWLTAALFHTVVENSLEILRPVRQLLAGGDVLSASAVKKVLREQKGITLINGYGPTENTTFTCCYPMTSPSQVGEKVPIGKPIANTTVYILDSLMQPVPIGVIGELYTGGDGVARGYLNRPELTKEKFIPDTFSNEPGARLYRIGDLARYRSDGNIEFLGRIDHQVKIRGFRIELGEIESILQRYAAIEECAVVMHEDRPGNKRLVAYIVPPERENEIAGEREGGFSIGDVRDFLRSQLPEYMVPFAFVVLDSLPLTPSGKLNRRALPEPQYTAEDMQDSIVKPRNTTEEQLVKIWEEVLGVSPIGITQSFFDLGGHSLLAVQLMVRIEEEFGVSLDLNKLWFEATTIETLAPLVRGEDSESKNPYLANIKAEGSRVPMFVVHTIGGGNLFHYDSIIQLLDPDQPVYGLQARGVGDGKAAHTTVEDMAAHCIQMMQEIVPEGPFLICGYSSGGVVAYEMAQQLRKSGQDNLLLIMIDAINPRLTDTLSDFVSFLRLSLKLKRYRAIQERIYHFLFSRLGLSKLRNLKTLGESHRWAQWSYVPSPYDGDVILFEALGSKKKYGDTHLGWKELVRGSLDVKFISSGHGFMVKGEHAKQVASLLQGNLDGFSEQYNDSLRNRG